MKITEFFNILKGINFDDEYDYLSVHFAGNYTGGIRDIKVVSNKVILSGEHDPHGFTLGFFDLYSKIKKLAQSADAYDYDVVYFVPSKGTYNVEGAKKNHYDYSYDGDGVYDCCDIYCSDEAISDGTDESHNFHEGYNKSKLFDKILNESSLKENECSLEQLLSKAHISEYKMVSKNSALVRVRTSPALLTSDSMAARFEEDIPDGYRLEVEYLGEDPILGKDLDIYEVQLLKN